MHYKTVRKMLDLHGITASMDTVALLQQIQECCDDRDQFAHGVWIRDDGGNLALRLTRGVFETPDGKADRSFLPEPQYVPRRSLFSDTRQDSFNNPPGA
jgi:hypothetical protein